ncbi:MAG: AAA family ATPase [Pseudomonadota bacterium]
MIEKLHVKWFKSIEDVEFEPSLVNVMIGANGSGKSNLLEAIGVLSAAAAGRIDDQSLLRRGVRPGVPALYKCSFRDRKGPLHIYFGAWSRASSYEVTLFNPIDDPFPAWRYHTEKLENDSVRIVGRSHRGDKKLNPEAGLAALKAVEMSMEDDALRLLQDLNGFAIFTPNTPTLRGIAPDTQQREPVGLSGGQLSRAVSDILKQRKNSEHSVNVCREALSLIDWATSYNSARASSLPLSSSAGATESVIRFEDRYMHHSRATLSGHDASEGALYVLFHAVLATHENTPLICAVDNADHALNPRLARGLFSHICRWYLGLPDSRQVFLTTHNPLTLDGLPLQDDRVRLFVVSRTQKGRTVVKRIVLDDKLKKLADSGWSLSRLWVMGHIGGVANV